MKCFGIATSLDQHDFDWFIPSQISMRFFVERSINNHKKEIQDYCNKLPSQTVTWLKKEGYFFYIHKLSNQCLIVLTDSELTQKQMHFLTYNVFIQKINPQELTNNIEKYTKDHKIEELGEKLTDVKETMIKNLELVIGREEKIETLLENTEKLQVSSWKFLEDAEELNSCWPSCVLF